MFRASLCPSSGAYQLQQQPLVYRRNVVVAVLLAVVGPVVVVCYKIIQMKLHLNTNNDLLAKMESSYVTTCFALYLWPSSGYNLVALRVYTGCPTRYRTRHLFNNSNTNEDIATNFEHEYVLYVGNEEECECSVCLSVVRLIVATGSSGPSASQTASCLTRLSAVLSVIWLRVCFVLFVVFVLFTKTNHEP